MEFSLLASHIKWYPPTPLSAKILPSCNNLTVLSTSFFVSTNLPKLFINFSFGPQS